MSSSFQRWTVTEPYLDLHCALGEGPYYEEATNRLRFVDIIKKHLHTVDLSIGPKSLKTLQLDMPVGVTADIEGIDSKKKILIGGKSGMYILDRETGKYELLKRFFDSEEKDERLRSNDGAIDPQGRFWVGTMNDFWVGEPQAEGGSRVFPLAFFFHPGFWWTKCLFSSVEPIFEMVAFCDVFIGNFAISMSHPWYPRDGYWNSAASCGVPRGNS